MDTEALKKYIERKDKRLIADRNETWHRKGYHRFFEGYAEYQVNVGNKKKIKRVYMGDYYCCDLPANRKVMLKILYILMLAASIFLFFASGNMQILSNYCMPVNLAQAFAVAGFVWCVMALFKYVISGRKLEIREYKTSVLSLRDATAVTAIVLGVVAAGMTVFMLAFDRGEMEKELFAIGFNLISLLFVAGINKLENGITYSRERSKNTIEDNAENVYFIKG